MRSPQTPANPAAAKALPIGRVIERGDRFTRAEVEQAWSDRRIAIVEHYAKSKNCVRTGRVFGISPQRVRQIVDAA